MNKKSIGIFFASAVLTALFLSLIISLIMIEHNTLKLGFGGNLEVFNFENNKIIINGKEYVLPLKETFSLLGTRVARILAAVFMML